MIGLPRPHLLIAAAVAGLTGPGAIAISAQGPARSPHGDSVEVSLPARAGGQLAAFKSDADFIAFLQKRQDALQRRAGSCMICRALPAPPPPAPAAEAAQANIVVTGSRQDVRHASPTPRKPTSTRAASSRSAATCWSSSAAAGCSPSRSPAARCSPIDHINAFPPGITGGGDWYDEMLISGDRVIVIGYSYARGGTEVNRFRLSPDGQLRFEDAYHLRSNDYYSSRNYASRLIGNRLVYYTPLYLGWGGGDPFAGFPAVSRWQKDSKPVFHRVARARDIYIVPSHRDDDEAAARHAAQRDGLQPHRAGDGLQGDAVLGPASRTFYVSPTAVYLWVSDARHWRAGSAARRKAGSTACRSTGSRSRRRSARLASRPTSSASARTGGSA